MNTPILIANILTLSAFFIHTFMGDRELRLIEPIAKQHPDHQQQEIWTMARGGWHWISVDLLFATIGLGLINFSDFFAHEKTLLQMLALYFFTYAVVWALVVTLSKQFPKNFLKLGQWILLLFIASLIFLGIE